MKVFALICSRNCSSFFMGLIFNLPKEKNGMRSVDLTPAVKDFTFTVKEWQGRTNGMDVRVHYRRQKELPSFVQAEGPPPKDDSTAVTSPSPTVSRKRDSSGNGKTEIESNKQIKKQRPNGVPPSPPSQSPSQSPSLPSVSTTPPKSTSPIPSPSASPVVIHPIGSSAVSPSPVVGTPPSAPVTAGKSLSLISPFVHPHPLALTLRILQPLHQ